MTDHSKQPANKSPAKPTQTIKTVRSQKIVADAVPVIKEKSESESEDSDDDPQPLPRSHTPGHLASRSINDQRRKPSDLSIRQRSQSAAQPVSNVPAPAGGQASRSKHPSGSNDNGAAEHPQDGNQIQKVAVPSRSTSAIALRQAQTASGATTTSTVIAAATPAPAPTRQMGYAVSRTPRGDHIPFPPLQSAKDAPDVPPAPASGMYWSKAPVSGSPHSSLRAHTTTLIGSNVYIFGGCDARTCFNAMYVLDADSFYWSVPYMVGDIPMPLRAMTCTAVGKKLVIFGGGDGPTYYNDVYVLDTVNFRWSKPRIVGEKLPSKRRAHTACLYKNGIYYFGGGDGVRALNDIWRLDVSDITKMSWKLISSAEEPSQTGKDRRPKARGYHTANMVGSKLIIFGGSDGGECFDDVWVYDVDTHVWKAVNIAVTFRRLSHTATIVGSYLFVIGGHDGNEYSNDVLLLNLVTMSWDKRKVYGLPPSGRGYHGTVLHDSRLLVIGGFDGSEVFGDVMTLELAVHAYYSQISHFTIDV